MHELIKDSIQALAEPAFRRAFVAFLALQRYDFTPYCRVFGVLDTADPALDGRLTVGQEQVSAETLAARFARFFAQARPDWELAELAEGFWSEFPGAVGDAGPEPYVRACRALGEGHELGCMMPMLRAPLLARPPRRVLDFGCGANRLGPAIQTTLQRAGLPAPTVIGVDLHVPEGAYADPARGVELHDLRRQSLPAILGQPVDLVVLKYVLHHMTEPEQEQALTAVGEVLAPQGRLVIIEASVDTDDADRRQFEAAQQRHECWPAADWVAPYRSVSRDFYRASGVTQRRLLCLEDVFGHVLLPGRAATAQRMPLPFSYVSRDRVQRLARQGGLEPDPELSAVLGLPPTLKHGPPSSRFVLRHAR